MVLDHTDEASYTNIFDGHSIAVSSDAMGTITFAGEGASSAQNTVDTTAAGDIWDQNSSWGSSAMPSNANAQNTLRWTMPAMVDGLAADVSYAGSAAGIEATIGYALTYTGVEGLSLTYAKGERGETATKGDIETMKASFAFGPITAAMSINDYKNDASANQEQTSYLVSYAVTDELSASFGSEVVETVSGTDQEWDRVKVAYTTGGLTLSASKSNADNVDGGSSTEQSHWDLGLSFAF
jgi:outer membrane protein OmpU